MSQKPPGLQVVLRDDDIDEQTVHAPGHPYLQRCPRGDAPADQRCRQQSQLADAAQAGDQQRTVLWPRLVDMYPYFAECQRRTTRQIPVMVLTPEREAASNP